LPMPSLLKHTECSVCGHRHHFCFTRGELTPGGEYRYVCPETGTRASLRPASAGEVVQHPPQGAVALELVADRPSGPPPAAPPRESLAGARPFASGTMPSGGSL